MAELTQDQINNFVIAAHHDLPLVQKTLAEFPELLNENAEWFETPIQAASHVYNRPLIDFLLAQGAPMDICTAAVLGRVDEVKGILVDDPEASQELGPHNLALMFYPAIVGNVEIAQILFDAGAEVNVAEGVTSPLHGAAIFGQAAMVTWLLEHDANPYAKEREGRTPLDSAEANGHEEAAALLRPFFAEAEGE
ncbi:MAG: ankyrin repeat domain-containing protein [Chloroflexota bacterium]